MATTRVIKVNINHRSAHKYFVVFFIMTVIAMVIYIHLVSVRMIASDCFKMFFNTCYCIRTVYIEFFFTNAHLIRAIVYETHLAVDLLETTKKSSCYINYILSL